MGLRISKKIEKIIQDALREDIGQKDITTNLFIPKDKNAKAVIVCKENDVIICGLPLIKKIFKLLDRKILFRPKIKEGARIKKEKVVAEIRGKARAILTAERTALNFLSFLSGIATFTYRFKKRIKPFNVKIMDTRKTHPNLRILERYAVRTGGGFNHRFKLDEMILIKDNHIKLVGDIEKTKEIIKKIPKHIKFEIEVKNIREFKSAQQLNPDIIMLDNMSLRDIKRIVKMRKKNIKLEVSGNVDLNNVRSIAKTGIEMISVGAITHSAKAVDFSLEIV